MDYLQALEDLIAKANTTTSNLTAIIPQLWAAQLEDNLRKREAFQQSIVQNTDLVGVPGDRVFMPTLPDIAQADDLTEDTDMTPIALTDAFSVPLIPAERGKAVGITRKALDRMKYDGMSAIVDRLAYSMSLKLEGTIAGLHSAAVPTFPAKKLVQYYPNGHASGTVVAADKFSDSCILDAATLLDDVDCVPFEDGMYRLYIHPEQYKALIKDADIRNDLRYASPERLLRGEVGALHNVRIVKSTHIKKVTENTQTVYKAILMAPRWAAVAWKRMPEMVVDPTVYDFGRRRRVGVVADFDIELLHEERAIVISTTA